MPRNTKQNLLDDVCKAIARYVMPDNDLTVYDILDVLEMLRHDITEEFIRQHPELIHMLHEH